jgi:hypothetical protein
LVEGSAKYGVPIKTVGGTKAVFHVASAAKILPAAARALGWERIDSAKQVEKKR